MADMLQARDHWSVGLAQVGEKNMRHGNGRLFHRVLLGNGAAAIGRGRIKSFSWKVRNDLWPMGESLSA